MATLRPDADNIDGNWLNETGSNANLYASVDEATSPYEVDYIRSPSPPNNDICVLRLSNPTGQTPREPFIVRCRFGKLGTEIVSLVVRLKQGATLIAEWTHSDISDEFATVEETLTTAQFESISDFDNLYVEFEAIEGTVSPAQGSPQGRITLDLVDDFDGSLVSWCNYCITERHPVTLTIPAGTFGSFLSTERVAYGGTDVIVNGAGASQTFLNVASVCDTGGGPIGTWPKDGLSPPLIQEWPRFLNADAGDSVITLKEVEQSARVIPYIGHWMLLLGIDLMGYGYPQNNFFNEFAKIVDVNETTGEVTLAAPLTWSYRQDWPKYVSGTSLQADQGGSPTMIGLKKHATGINTWDCDLQIRDVAIPNPHSYFGSTRSLLWEDCVFPEFSTVPSVSKSTIYRRCTLLVGLIEVDKCVDYLEYDDCDIRSLQSQSGGTIDLMVVRNSRVESFAGTVKRTQIIDGSDVETLLTGPVSYGASLSLYVANSNVDVLTIHTGRTVAFDPAWMASSPAGVIAVPWDDVKFTTWQTCACPGATYMFRDANSGTSGFTYLGPCFQIEDMWTDGSFVYYQTTLTGNERVFEYMAGSPSAVNLVSQHSCPSLEVISSTGCPDMESYSKLTGARPGFEYMDITVTGPSCTTAAGQTLLGKINSIVVDVTQAYTGSHPGLTMWPLGGMFGMALWPDWPLSARWPLQINLKIAGRREITPTTVSGKQTGDSFSPPGDVWMTAATARKPYLRYSDGGATTVDLSDENPATWPIVHIVVDLDQSAE